MDVATGSGITPAGHKVESLKIGEVAARLGISIRTIHMYEREGLLIAFKNSAGTRYFSEEDVSWLEEIRRMIKWGIGIPGIRRLLSLIPCWNYKGCAFEARQKCPVNVDETAPCWANKDNHCAENSQECRLCPVYEMRFCVSTLKQFLDIRFKPSGEQEEPPIKRTQEPRQPRVALR